MGIPLKMRRWRSLEKGRERVATGSGAEGGRTSMMERLRKDVHDRHLFVGLFERLLAEKDSVARRVMFQGTFQYFRS